MQGSAMTSLNMFNKLCGENALHKVVLVTTMWENLKTTDQGETKEEELRNTDEFWGWMEARGSKVERHMNNAESAKRLLEMFVPSDKQKSPENVVLTIQEEIADQNKLLEDTKAGEVIHDNIRKERTRITQALEEYQQRAREAMLKRDTKRHQEMEEIMAGMRQQEYTLRRNREVLSADMEQMVRAKFDQRVAEMEEEKLMRLSTQYSVRSESSTEISTSQGAGLESPAWPNTPPSPALLQRHSTFKSSRGLSLSLRGRHCSFISPGYTKS